MAPCTRWRRPDSNSRQDRALPSSSVFGKMRRPQATTVSAPRIKAPGWRGITVRAFSSAKRITYAGGTSPRRGVSSISGGSMQSGAMPTWRSSSRRRGDAEASTNGGPVTQLTPQMQYANQGEEAPRGIEIDLDLVGETFHQQGGS